VKAERRASSAKGFFVFILISNCPRILILTQRDGGVAGPTCTLSTSSLDTRCPHRVRQERQMTPVTAPGLQPSRRKKTFKFQRPTTAFSLICMFNVPYLKLNVHPRAIAYIPNLFSCASSRSRHRFFSSFNSETCASDTCPPTSSPLVHGSQCSTCNVKTSSKLS
jgi:hypothetical protein